MSKKIKVEQVQSSEVCYQTLEQWAREKIQVQLQSILEEEVTQFLSRPRYERREECQIDVPRGSRNGHGKPRKLSMMGGTLTVRRPRVRGLIERFESRILPLFKRRSQEVGELLPKLYLHGLSTGDFDLALRGLLGDGAPLSASSIQRLKSCFQVDFEDWSKKDLSDMELVYWWADGLYVKAGIEDRKSALLTIIGALSNGEKVLIACQSGERESKESWLRVLRDLKARGLKFPKLTVADGHLGIWSALGEIHPAGDEQRCWNHKIANVVNELPRKLQSQGREMLKVIPYAGTRSECEKLRDKFVARFEKNEKRATQTLMRDWERMVSFYSFPKEHWKHIRTTNIVESPFSSVRLRTDASRRYKKVENAQAVIWKVLTVAEQAWRKLDAPELLPMVVSGVKFENGKQVKNEKRKAEIDQGLKREAA